MHKHDAQARIETGHPGSKHRSGAPGDHPFKRGERLHHVSGGHEGTVSRVDYETGAFTVTYDEPIAITRTRKVTYPAYLARNFRTGPAQEAGS